MLTVKFEVGASRWNFGLKLRFGVDVCSSDIAFQVDVLNINLMMEPGSKDLKFQVKA